MARRTGRAGLHGMRQWGSKVNEVNRLDIGPTASRLHPLQDRTAPIL